MNIQELSVSDSIKEKLEEIEMMSILLGYLKLNTFIYSAKKINYNLTIEKSINYFQVLIFSNNEIEFNLVPDKLNSNGEKVKVKRTKTKMKIDNRTESLIINMLDDILKSL